MQGASLGRSNRSQRDAPCGANSETGHMLVGFCLLEFIGKEVSNVLFAPVEKGQGLVEYALILVLVVVVVIVILALMGPAIGRIFSNVVEMV